MLMDAAMTLTLHFGGQNQSSNYWLSSLIKASQDDDVIAIMRHLSSYNHTLLSHDSQLQFCTSIPAVSENDILISVSASGHISLTFLSFIKETKHMTEAVSNSDDL